MFKKTITYTDFNGNERTEDYYFHLSKAELAEMDLSKTGGFQSYIERIIAADDRETLVALFKGLILDTYGEKDVSGKRFIKSPELSEAFSQTPAYSELFMELLSNEDAAAEFVNNVIPSDLQKLVAEHQQASLQA